MFSSDTLAGVQKDMSERSGGELLEERSCISERSERSCISRRSEISERSGISQRSQISEKSQRSEKSQIEKRDNSDKTEDKLSAFACNLNSESKSEVDMHPLREVRK